MTQEKARLRLSVSQEVLDYIEDVKEEQNLSFNGDAVAFLVADHQRLKKEQWSLHYVAEAVSENLFGVLKEELTRIRLGTNSADRNAQVLIELLNGLMIHESIDDILTTDQMEVNGVTTAKKAVQDRIENQRQKRSNRQFAYQPKE